MLFLKTLGNFIGICWIIIFHILHFWEELSCMFSSGKETKWKTKIILHSQWKNKKLIGVHSLPQEAVQERRFSSGSAEHETGELQGWNSGVACCLSCSGCSNRRHKVDPLKADTYVSQIWSWKIKMKKPEGWGSGEHPLLVPTWVFSPCPHRAMGARAVSGVFQKDTDPISRDCTFSSQLLSRDPNA